LIRELIEVELSKILSFLDFHSFSSVSDHCCGEAGERQRDREPSSGATDAKRGGHLEPWKPLRFGIDAEIGIGLGQMDGDWDSNSTR